MIFMKNLFLVLPAKKLKTNCENKRIEAVTMIVWLNCKRFLYFLTIVCVFGITGTAYSQNLSPPFPRIGQIYFYPLGSGDEIWKNHDLIGIRHYESSDARKIKAKNPDILLLAANDVIEGTPIEDLLGKTLPEVWFIHYANGDRLPIWGGFLMNITEKCPEADFIYGSQKFNQFVAQFLVNNTNWDYFDGSYFDSWISGLVWMGFNMDQIDLDYDGQADGAGSVNSSWDRGNRVMIDNMRALSDKLIIAHEGVELFLNGNAFEFWSQLEDPPSGHAANLGKLFDFRDNAVAPIVNFCNGEADGTLFRADLTSAMLGDGFFGHDEGTFAHRYTFFHDEYESNLGYPEGNPQEIESGLWIRYFDYGMILSNISGQQKTVRSNQVSGGPYWRFRGAQEPDFNNGLPFDDNNPINFAGMDGILLVKEPKTFITPIIIDNVEKNMTSIDQRPVKYTGNWTQSVDGRYAYVLGYAWDELGNYHAYSQQGSGENKAEYKPSIKVSGDYEIFEWHGSIGQTSATNVPYQILKDGNEISSGRIDQTRNIGQWNSLGVFSFLSGNSILLILTNNANGVVLSDAVKFEFKSDENIDKVPPNPPNNLENTEKTENSLLLKWQAPAPASDGETASYYTVYRDGQFLNNSSKPEYLDQNLQENSSYNYDIFAVDGVGNRSESSASGTFFTLADLIPPVLTRVSPLTMELLEVEFSEKVTQSSVTNIQNFSISKGISVLNAVMDSEGKIVRLNTTAHNIGEEYTISVQNILDGAKTPNVIISPNFFSYFFSNDNFNVAISADNIYDLYVNGTFVGSDSSWENLELYSSLPLQTGENVIAIKVENSGNDAAGLICEIWGSSFSFFSNPMWKISTQAYQNWEVISFDDKNWHNAKSLGLVISAQPWISYQTIAGINNPNKVHWIWTENSGNENVVYFRFSFNLLNLDSTPPAAPQGIIIKQK